MTLIFNRTRMKERRRELRKNETEAENVLWEQIRDRKLAGIKFRRQYSIGAFVVDFYCPSLKLAIEVDGSVHETEKAKIYDRYRQKGIEELKIKFLRFSNSEIVNDISQVLDIITQTAIAHRDIAKINGGNAAEKLD
jgi:very-short-patch-repair endonuclease